MTRYDLSEPDLNLDWVVAYISGDDQTSERTSEGVMRDAVYPGQLWSCSSKLRDQVVELLKASSQVEDKPESLGFELYTLINAVYHVLRGDVNPEVSKIAEAVMVACRNELVTKLRTTVESIGKGSIDGDAGMLNRRYIDIYKNLHEARFALRNLCDDELKRLLSELASERKRQSEQISRHCEKIASRYSAAYDRFDETELDELDSIDVVSQEGMGIGTLLKSRVQPGSRISTFQSLWRLRESREKLARFVHKDAEVSWRAGNDSATAFLNAVSVQDTLDLAKSDDLWMLRECTGWYFYGDYQLLDLDQSWRVCYKEYFDVCFSTNEWIQTKVGLMLILPAMFASYARASYHPIVIDAANKFLPFLRKLDGLNTDTLELIVNAARIIAPDTELSIGRATIIYLHARRNEVKFSDAAGLATWMRDAYGNDLKNFQIAVMDEQFVKHVRSVQHAASVDLQCGFGRKYYESSGFAVAESDQVMTSEELLAANSPGKKGRVKFKECEYCIRLFGIDFPDDFERAYIQLSQQPEWDAIWESVIYSRARDLLGVIQSERKLSTSLAMHMLPHETGCPAIIGHCIARLVVRHCPNEGKLDAATRLGYSPVPRGPKTTDTTDTTAGKTGKSDKSKRPPRPSRPLDKSINDGLRKWGLSSLNFDMVEQFEGWKEKEDKFAIWCRTQKDIKFRVD